MKLWVDDIRNAPDETWTVARTVGAAIRCIAMFGDEIEVISLDHDISHQVHMDELSRPFPCAETFEAVAWYIALYYGFKCKPGAPKLPLVRIHTSNPIGADTMKTILENNGVTRIERVRTGVANRLEMEV